MEISKILTCINITIYNFIVLKIQEITFVDNSTKIEMQFFNFNFDKNQISQ